MHPCIPPGAQAQKRSQLILDPGCCLEYSTLAVSKFPLGYRTMTPGICQAGACKHSAPVYLLQSSALIQCSCQSLSKSTRPWRTPVICLQGCTANAAPFAVFVTDTCDTCAPSQLNIHSLAFSKYLNSDLVVGQVDVTWQQVGSSMLFHHPLWFSQT